MAYLPKFDSNVNYSQEYLKKYGRFVDLPSAKYISVKFHPSLQDHIVVLSEINGPKNTQVETLVPSSILGQFETKMDSKYLDIANKQIVRRKRQTIYNPGFEISKTDTFLDDITSESFDDDDVYEGGEDENLRKTQSELTKRSTPNERIKGHDIAVDLYVEDKSNVLTYKYLDPALRRGKVEDISDEESEGHSEDSDSEFDEEIDFQTKTKIEFKKLPKYKGLEYIPPAIRYQYEISLWKVDSYGATKVKNAYFTPSSSKIFGTDFKGFSMEMSFDKHSILIIEKESLETTTLLLMFDAFTLDKIIETSLSTCNTSNKLHDNTYNKDEDFHEPQKGEY